MVRIAYGWVLAAGAAALGTLAQQPVAATTGDDETRLAEAASAATQLVGDAANLTLQYIQEDGPESGHVRIVLVPETMPLTLAGARAAAQEAFLGALTEPGLGDNLSRITVVVKLMPASHPDPVSAEQVIVYQHKGGRDWSVLAGE
jgi:hypothetical protein